MRLVSKPCCASIGGPPCRSALGSGVFSKAMDAEEDDLIGDDEGSSDLASADEDGTDAEGASKVEGEAPAADEVDLVPVPEAGRIFLDRVSDVRWVLTDIVTRDTH